MLDSLTSSEKRELADLLEELERRKSRRLFYRTYPEDGPLCRANYPKHMMMFALGAKHRERAFIAGNRTGKTFSGSYEATCHTTGLYPDWWTGKRFDTATSGWCAGKTAETTRDIIQVALIGEDPDSPGTGMIPGDLIVDCKFRPNTNKSLDYVMVRHSSGGVSRIGLKSYDQRRKAFEGTARHWIWLDEEPPADIYSECLIRTATLNGIVVCTFTPLEGATDVVRGFLEEAEETHV